jgi:hypothetical protein
MTLLILNAVTLTPTLVASCSVRHSPRCGVVQACDAKEGSLMALSLPAEPSEALSPNDVVSVLCRGLQHNHIPSCDTGLRRLFAFATYECRAALTARKGKETVERFMKYAESPALVALLGCRSFKLLGEPTVIVGTQTRGALATQVVVVEETLGFRFRSGHERPEAERAEETRSERYLFTLTLERRPPLQGCWLVKELLPMRHHMMFAGDSGGTVT